jgi:hypothetical protein
MAAGDRRGARRARGQRLSLELSGLLREWGLPVPTR